MQTSYKKEVLKTKYLKDKHITALLKKLKCKTSDILDNNQNAKIINTLIDYIIFLKTIPENDIDFYFKHIIVSIIYEICLEKEVKEAGRDNLKHLQDLPELTESMSGEEKLIILTDLFDKLSDKNSPVRNNIFYMTSIKKIRIIKDRLNKF